MKEGDTSTHSYEVGRGGRLSGCGYKGGLAHILHVVETQCQVLILVLQRFSGECLSIASQEPAECRGQEGADVKRVQRSRGCRGQEGADVKRGTEVKRVQRSRGCHVHTCTCTCTWTHLNCTKTSVKSLGIPVA